MKEEEGKFFVYGRLGVAHGRAATGTSRGNSLEICWFWVLMVWHRRATTGTGRAKLLVILGFKKIHFSIHFWKIPTKQIKTTQNKQKKSN